MNTKQTIINVINTLNLISVSGKQNLDHLFASIMALEAVVKDMDTPKPEPQIELVQAE